MITETIRHNAVRDWPTLLANNARTGGQSPRPFRSPDKAAWQIRTGGAVRSAPILDEGTLYVASVNGEMHALDVATGTSKWKFQAAGQLHSTPSLYGNKVLFGCDDGKTYAI